MKLRVAYWSAVRDTFPDAWGLSPTESRLMGGVGIRSLSRLMDRIVPHIDLKADDPKEQVKVEIARIAPYCHWTSGNWEELGWRWDELQNVPKHISTLSNYLVRKYVAARSAG